MRRRARKSPDESDRVETETHRARDLAERPELVASRAVVGAPKPQLREQEVKEDLRLDAGELGADAGVCASTEREVDRAMLLVLGAIGRETLGIEAFGLLPPCGMLEERTDHREQHRARRD